MVHSVEFIVVHEKYYATNSKLYCRILMYLLT